MCFAALSIICSVVTLIPSPINNPPKKSPSHHTTFNPGENQAFPASAPAVD